MNANKQDAGGEVTNPDNVGGLPEFVAVGEFVGYGRVTGEPHVRMSSGLRPGVRLFTEDQMRAYGELCRAAPAGSGEVHPIPQELFDRAHRLRELAAANRLNECLPTIETMCGKNAGDAIRDAAAILRKLQQGADYVIVPREPTDEMVWAGRDAWTAAHHAMKAGESRYPMTETWRAMIAASQGQEGGHVEG
jgi:hypothetical protein